MRSRFSYRALGTSAPWVRLEAHARGDEPPQLVGEARAGRPALAGQHLGERLAQAAEDHRPGQAGVDVVGDLAALLAAADVGGGLFDVAAQPRRLDGRDLGLASEPAEDDRRERIVEV